MTNPDQVLDEGYVPDWSNVARPRGAWVFLVLVALGVMPAGYYAYTAPRLHAEHQRQLAMAPTTLEGRVDAWHYYGAPNIHHRIATMGRVSEETPWIVTHRIDLGDGGFPEVWGVDTLKLPRLISRVEGSQVIVELPAPVLLGRVDLSSLNSRQLPTFTDASQVPDPNWVLQSKAFWFLEKMPEGLAADIEGASLEVRIVPTAAPSQR